jgi:putative hydrolase of the HAD superfamily
MIKLIIFDFGGVIAEEGFREGLMEIGRKNGLDSGRFFSVAEKLIYESGYVTGNCPEAEYWTAVRKETGIDGTDRDLREEIIARFILRPPVLSLIDRLRSQGFPVIMLSDQTNWLDEISAKSSLFAHFDRVYNSYHTKRSKRDISIFPDVCRDMDVQPFEAVFIDDNSGHIARAASTGLRTVHYTSLKACEQQLTMLMGGVGSPDDEQ